MSSNPTQAAAMFATLATILDAGVDDARAAALRMAANPKDVSNYDYELCQRLIRRAQNENDYDVTSSLAQLGGGVKETIASVNLAANIVSSRAHTDLSTALINALSEDPSLLDGVRTPADVMRRATSSYALGDAALSELKSAFEGIPSYAASLSSPGASSATIAEAIHTAAEMMNPDTADITDPACTSRTTRFVPVGDNQFVFGWSKDGETVAQTISGSFDVTAAAAAAYTFTVAIFDEQDNEVRQVPTKQTGLNFSFGTFVPANHGLLIYARDGATVIDVNPLIVAAEGRACSTIDRLGGAASTIFTIGSGSNATWPAAPAVNTTFGVVASHATTREAVVKAVRAKLDADFGNLSVAQTDEAVDAVFHPSWWTMASGDLTESEKRALYRWFVPVLLIAASSRVVSA